MDIRPITDRDVDAVFDIDGTIESPCYLHIESSGEGLGMSWRIEERTLREKLIDPNRLTDDQKFVLKQVAMGIEDGFSLVAEHEDALVGSAVAVTRPDRGALEIIDLRVDYEQRRQGLGLAMLFQCVAAARKRQLRAVSARTLSNNAVAAAFLSKAAFDIAGLDTRRTSNHDLVKEKVTLFWYLALD